jgi:uncharacterized protein YhaN
MINRILQIKNVGKFVNFSSKGDIEFRKMTLVFGENGRGKTMLAAILRSLGTGDPTSLLKRTLDDALVSADPQRRAALLSILEEHSAVGQVILLTCQDWPELSKFPCLRLA